MAEKKFFKKYWLEQLTTDISIIFNKNLQSEKQKKNDMNLHQSQINSGLHTENGSWMRLCLRTDWFNQNNKITLHFKDIKMIVSLLIDKKYED